MEAQVDSLKKTVQGMQKNIPDVHKKIKEHGMNSHI